MPTIGHARQAIADARSRAELYRMWHTGFHAGLHHARTLEAVGQRTESPATEAFRTALIAGFDRRSTLSAIVADHAALTQPFERAVLALGDEAGSLQASLATLATHFAAEHSLLRTVWSKLTYPLVTSFAAIMVAPLGLLIGGRTTAYLVIVATGFTLWYAFGGSAVAALARRYANRPAFMLARLARALAGGVEAGLPLDRVIALAAASTGHPRVIAHVRALSARQLAAQPLSETFAGCPAVPFEMIAALRVAEASGDFSTGLRKLAELYDGRTG
ncbi:MAG TPA: type II secretion system F family protein [Longimicrobiales bacterium]|nr:type II secretion system F family protein [Longimicrobiales bacterium]